MAAHGTVTPGTGRPGTGTPRHREGWGSVVEALDELTGARATGALHVDGPVSGSVYLLDGDVYYVHTPAAPGVDCLLQASGTVSPAAFQTAWTAGAAAGQVGEILIKSGALSRGEAELCTAAAITDGAFVLFTTSAADVGQVRFAPEEGHWWGALRRVGAAALDTQIRKRLRLLERTPPGDVDDQPVVAAGRLGRHHVVLTDLQWELIVHANGRRTPRELARLLGRSAFSAIVECRRLVTVGLIQVARAPEEPTGAPRPAGQPGPTAAASPGADPVPGKPPTAARSTVARSAAARSASTSAVGTSGGTAEPPPGHTPETAGTAEPAEGWRTGLRSARTRRKPDLPTRRSESPGSKPDLPARRPEPAHPMPLPRRQPGAALRGVVPAPVGAEPRGEPSILDVPEPDFSLLSRVRNALEALR